MIAIEQIPMATIEDTHMREAQTHDPERFARFVSSFGAFIPFAYQLGFELESSEHGAVTLLFSPKEEHLNSLHVTHGGAVMTLMDVAMASAARTLEPSQRMVTIEMKTSFFNPAQGALRVKAELLHRTRQMAFVQANLHDEEGVLCAHSTGTFRFVSPKA
jgi:uncharacterized protein (TIGR00369 family)